MNRRAVLRTLPAAAMAVPAAGCAAPGRSGGDAPRTRSPTPTKTDRPIEFDPERVATEVTLGDRTEGVEELRPHSIRVWNDSPTERTVAIALRRGPEPEPVLDEAFAVPADASVAVVLNEPAAYTAALRSGEATATIAVAEKWFDCNYSATEVALSADEGFRWQFVTTFAECRS